MKVTQEIPSGTICAKLECSRLNEGDCIFLDFGGQIVRTNRHGEFFSCRRYPEYELGVENHDNGIKSVLKCPRCLQECAIETEATP